MEGKQNYHYINGEYGIGLKENKDEVRQQVGYRDASLKKTIQINI